MNIQASKIELVKLILNIDSQSLIEKVLDVLRSEKEDFYLDLSEQEKREINLGIQQLNEGKRISLDDFLKTDSFFINT